MWPAESKVNLLYRSTVILKGRRQITKLTQVNFSTYVLNLFHDAVLAYKIAFTSKYLDVNNISDEKQTKYLQYMSTARKSLERYYNRQRNSKVKELFSLFPKAFNKYVRQLCYSGNILDYNDQTSDSFSDVFMHTQAANIMSQMENKEKDKSFWEDFGNSIIMDTLDIVPVGGSGMLALFTDLAKTHKDKADETTWNRAKDVILTGLAVYLKRYYEINKNSLTTEDLKPGFTDRADPKKAIYYTTDAPCRFETESSWFLGTDDDERTTPLWRHISTNDARLYKYGLTWLVYKKGDQMKHMYQQKFIVNKLQDLEVGTSSVSSSGKNRPRFQTPDISVDKNNAFNRLQEFLKQKIERHHMQKEIMFRVELTHDEYKEIHEILDKLDMVVPQNQTVADSSSDSDRSGQVFNNILEIAANGTMYYCEMQMFSFDVVTETAAKDSELVKQIEQLKKTHSNDDIIVLHKSVPYKLNTIVEILDPESNQSKSYLPVANVVAFPTRPQKYKKFFKLMTRLNDELNKKTDTTQPEPTTPAKLQPITTTSRTAPVKQVSQTRFTTKSPTPRQNRPPSKIALPSPKTPGRPQAKSQYIKPTTPQKKTIIGSGAQNKTPF